MTDFIESAVVSCFLNLHFLKTLLYIELNFIKEKKFSYYYYYYYYYIFVLRN